MNSHMRKVRSTGIVVAVAGCAATPPPTLQTGPDREITVDGLVRVDNAVVPVAYRKPDMDLTPYIRFMLDPVEVAYQKDPGNRRRSGVAGDNDNFALSPSQMETLKDMFQEAVVEALTKDDGYELTTEPGPDVLRITASLIDLVVSVPTDRVGNQQVFTQSYGLVSLIIELRDSQSGEILARAADRRDPTRPRNGNLVRVSSAFIQADVRLMFRYWGDLLRVRLDALRSM
jgi:hypothetical protein